MFVGENANREPVQSVVCEQIMSPDSEQRLLSRVGEDQAAFWPLWQHHQPYVYRCCLKWTNNWQDAEDALSEVMLKARHLLPRHAGQIRDLQAWFGRLAQNHCIDRHRQQSRQATNHHKLEQMAFSSADSPLLPDEVVENSEMYQCVRRAIATLPPGMREVVILRLLKQNSTQETASYLNISERLVRQRVQRARPLLQEPLKRYLMAQEHKKASSSRRTASYSQAASFAKGRFDSPLVVPKAVPEISADVVTIPLIPVTLASGVDMFFHFPLRSKASRLAQKLSTLRSYLERHPTSRKRRWELAELLVASGAWQEAIEVYHQLLRQGAEIEVYLKLGQILHLQGRNREAIAVYEQALEVAQQESTRYHLRGLIATCRWQPKKAINAFETAISLSPDNAAHWHALGLTQLQAGLPALANETFEQALQLNPDDLLALTHSCQALALEGKVEMVCERARKILNLDSANLLALKQLIDARIQQQLVWGNEGKETKRLIRRAQKLAPHAPDIHDSRARYHHSRSEEAKALNILQTFADAHPKAPAAWCHYAQWLFRTGKRQAAIESMLKAYALHPHDLTICRAVSAILPPSHPQRQEIALRLSEYERI